VSEDKHAMFHSKGECEGYTHELADFGFSCEVHVEDCDEGALVAPSSPLEHNVGERHMHAINLLQAASQRLRDTFPNNTEWAWNDEQFCGGVANPQAPDVPDYIEFFYDVPVEVCGGGLLGKWYPQMTDELPPDVSEFAIQINQWLPDSLPLDRAEALEPVTGVELAGPVEPQDIPDAPPLEVIQPDDIPDAPVLEIRRTDAYADDPIPANPLPPDGQGALAIDNPGGVWYEVWYIGMSELRVANNATFEWALPPGTYEIRQQGRRVLDVTVVAGMTIPVHLATGFAAVSNPGGVWYELWEVGGAAPVVANNATFEWGLVEGEYEVRMQGRAVLTFYALRGETIPVPLPTGLASMNNPGGVWYELWEIGGTFPIVANNITFDWGLVEGDYEARMQGRSILTFTIQPAATTPVSLPTGIAAIENPGGVWYELWEVGGTFPIVANNVNNHWGLVAGNYEARMQGRSILTFSVETADISPVSLPTGIAAIENPGGVWYELWEIGGTFPIVANNVTYNWGLVAGGYEARQNGQVVATFTVEHGGTTPVRLS